MSNTTKWMLIAAAAVVGYFLIKRADNTVTAESTEPVVEESDSSHAEAQPTTGVEVQNFITWAESVLTASVNGDATLWNPGGVKFGAQKRIVHVDYVDVTTGALTPAADEEILALADPFILSWMSAVGAGPVPAIPGAAAPPLYWTGKTNAQGDITYEFMGGQPSDKMKTGQSFSQLIGAYANVYLYYKGPQGWEPLEWAHYDNGATVARLGGHIRAYHGMYYVGAGIKDKRNEKITLPGGSVGTWTPYLIPISGTSKVSSRAKAVG